MPLFNPDIPDLVTYQTEAELQLAPNGWAIANITNDTDWPVLFPSFGAGQYPVRVTGYDSNGWAGKTLEVFSGPGNQVRTWEAYTNQQYDPLTWATPKWKPDSLLAPSQDPPNQNETYLYSFIAMGSTPKKWLQTWTLDNPFPEEGPTNTGGIPRYDYGGSILVNDSDSPRSAVSRGYVDGKGGNILTGIEPPVAGLGAAGDYYLDTDADVLYGPKNGAYTRSRPLLVPSGIPAASSVSGHDARGVKFTVDTLGRVLGIRFAQYPNEYGNQVAMVAASDLSTNLGQGYASSVAQGLFNEILFDTPVDVASGTEYAVYYRGNFGQEVYSAGALPGPGEHVTLVTAMQGSYYLAENTTGNFWIEPIFESATTVAWPVALVGASGIANAPPTSATAPGKAGDTSYDANYFYICTATNTWKRVEIAAW